MWYYLTDYWEDKGFHTFLKRMCPKVNVIAWLSFELAYYDSATNIVSYYAMNIFFHFLYTAFVFSTVLFHWRIFCFHLCSFNCEYFFSLFYPRIYLSFPHPPTHIFSFSYWQTNRTRPIHVIFCHPSVNCVPWALIISMPFNSFRVSFVFVSQLNSQVFLKQIVDFFIVLYSYCFRADINKIWFSFIVMLDSTRHCLYSSTKYEFFQNNKQSNTKHRIE